MSHKKRQVSGQPVRQLPGQPGGQLQIDPEKASAFGEEYQALCAKYGLALVAEAGMEAWPGQPPKPLARLKLVSIPLAEPNVGGPGEPMKPDSAKKRPNGLSKPKPVPDATPGDPPEATDESC